MLRIEYSIIQASELSLTPEAHELLSQESALSSINEQKIFENEEHDVLTDCVDKSATPNNSVLCGKGQYFPNDSIMANSTLIMRSQSYRA